MTCVGKRQCSTDVGAVFPRELDVLLVYACYVGVPRSRKIEKACHEDATFRVFSDNLQPDHSRISFYSWCL